VRGDRVQIEPISEDWIHVLAVFTYQISLKIVGEHFFDAK